ncbi:hypothetical protein [Actinacidiphila bryophytorum]|uniref:hypothetical protein n=1 Tax=Actinacidiphila bryophytorum TaxID=1436133 RepID=UPI002176EF51|nr:hypothetical protein [Actinacidiphila bryophytorum]UWE12252.1 hypothetical protein NYE86_28550 [Actinacidiphila bryophytorum]
MSDGFVEPKRLVSQREWGDPAGDRKLHAVAQTSMGEAELYRRRSTAQDFDARANSLENWELVIGGETKVTVRDAAAPGISLQKRMRTGIHGEILGVEFRAQAAMRNVMSRFRHVDFTSGDRVVSFRAHGFRRVMSSSGGGVPVVLTQKRKGRWNSTGLDEADTLVLVLFVLAELEFFLDTPLGDLSPI